MAELYFHVWIYHNFILLVYNIMHFIILVYNLFISSLINGAFPDPLT